MSVNENASNLKDNVVTEPAENMSVSSEEIAEKADAAEGGVSEDAANTPVDSKASEAESKEGVAFENNESAEKNVYPDKYSKKTIMIACSLIAFILGILIGRFSQPKGKLDSVLVTESASAEDSDKEYTQIVTIMDNAKHVVEERYYKSDGAPAALY